MSSQNTQTEVKWYLPDFFNLYQINSAFINLFTHQDVVNPHYKIGAIYGSFPGAYWNGGRTMTGWCEKENVLATISDLNNRNIPVRYTFTNCLITPDLLKDPYCNFLMEAANTGMNEVLVNHPLLEEYLRDKYPDFKYIVSTTRCVLSDSEIKESLDDPKNYLVVLDYRKNHDGTFLFSLSDEEKSKLELLTNAYCSPDCKKRKAHYEYLSKCQIDHSIVEPFCDTLCQTFYEAQKLSTTITPDEIPVFVKGGFYNFKIEGRTLHPMDVIESYIKYLVYEEYRDEVRYDICRRLWGM